MIVDDDMNLGATRVGQAIAKPVVCQIANRQVCGKITRAPVIGYKTISISHIGLDYLRIT